MLRGDSYGSRTSRLRESFEEYDRENPNVWDLFVKYTLDAIRVGREHYSARTIIHRIRWHVHIETRSGDGFKINNNHSPYYARKFEALYPDHVGFFQNREAEGDRERGTTRDD